MPHDRYMDPERPPLIRRADALANGYTDGEISRARCRGELRLVRRGVYVRPALLDGLNAAGQHRLLIEATMGASAGVVSHVSAAVLHGLPVWNISLARVHVTVDASSGGRVVRRRHVHAVPLAAEDVTVTPDGLAVTSVARTVVDLARTVGFEEAVAIGDAALHARLATPEDLLAVLERAGRRPGTPAARRVLGFLDGRSESVGESRSRVQIAAHGLPAPQLQRLICDVDGVFVARVDFHFEEFDTVGEFDGLAKYLRDPASSVVQEKLREDAVRATGPTVVRWIWSELSPFDGVVRRLRHAFGLRRR